MKHLKNVNGIALICRNVINQGKKANQNMPTLADFETAKACGFNAVMYPGSDVPPTQWISYTKDALDYCQQTGLIMISNSPILGFNSNVDGVAPYAKDWPVSFVSQFVNHPALGGWQVKDEPSYLDWHESLDANNNSVHAHNSPLINNYRNIRAIDNQNLVFMNLAVSYDATWIGNNSTYPDYLHHYNQVFNPSILCYDYYPIDCVTNSQGEIISLRVQWVTFYNTLATFAYEAKRTNKPFWAYCLCYQHRTEGRIYPYPTEGMLRFYVFSALAYGAQGIIYWKYRIGDNETPALVDNNPNKTKGEALNEKIESPNIVGSIEEQGSTYLTFAPIDHNGNKTSIWYSIKKINSEVRRYNHIFYQCDVRNTYRFQSTVAKEIWDQGVGCIRKLKTEEFGVLISNIVNNGNYYIVIVNSDPFNKQNIQIVFDTESYGVYDVGIASGPQTSWDDSQSEEQWVSRTLDEGGYLIIKYTRK